MVSKHSEALPPHFRRNFVALMMEPVFFVVAFTFISPTSVLPAFVGELTDSAPVVGLVSTAFSFSVMLPQLAVARLVSDKPRKKPYMLAGLAGRVSLLIIALALWAGLARHHSRSQS